MPSFSYIARSKAGERLEGVVEAADKRAAMALVERKGLVPVSVKEAGGVTPVAKPTAAKKPPPAKPSAPPPAKKASAKSAPKKHFRLEWRHNRPPRMKSRELLLFTRELSDLLASGMTLGNALHALCKHRADRESDKLIAELRDEIIQGTSLSEALARRPESFSALYVSMVRAGEASGQLSLVLERLCRHFERAQEAREKVLMALTYPGIVLTMGVGTMIFTMVFVIPRFSAIFAELGSTLPLPTRMLIAISTGLIHYGWALGIGAVVAIVMLRRYLRTKPGKRQWSRLQLRLPIVKSIVTANAYGHFARTLSTLLANGVQVLQALAIVESASENVVIAEAIREARDKVTDGATISKPLAAGGIFPPLLTDMLAVGEETGDMSGALDHIARRYDGELDRNVKVFTTILEPIMILFMAAMVGFVALSLLLAVFDLTSGLKVN